MALSVTSVRLSRRQVVQQSTDDEVILPFSAEVLDASEGR